MSNVISIGTDLLAKNPIPLKHSSFQEIIEEVRTSSELSKLTKAVRSAKDKAARGAEKKKLPFISTSIFKDGIRRNENFIETHLIHFDLDGLNGSLETIKTKLAHDPFVHAVFTSPGGEGLKIFFLLSEPIKGIPTYKATWGAQAQRIEQAYGVEPDPSCKDVSRACFLSHDPQAYFNEHAEVVPVIQPQSKREPSQTGADNTDAPDMAELGQAVSFIIAENNRTGAIYNSYSAWQQIILALASMGEPARQLAVRVTCENTSYSETEADADAEFTKCLEHYGRQAGGAVTWKSIFKLAYDNGWQAPRRVYADREPWGEPLPLPDKLPPVKSLEPVMLPEPLRGWIMDVADRMQVPPDFTAAAAIVALGAVIGRGCGIYPKCHDDWLVVPNSWGYGVGRPSLMKTPAISEVIKFVKRLELSARDEHDQSTKTLDTDKAIYQAKRAAIEDEMKKAAKKGSESELDAARAKMDALPPIYIPHQRRYMVQDSTTEKLGELLTQNPRGLLVYRDELTAWFHLLDKDGRQGDRQFFLESWDGYKSFNVERIGRGSIRIDAHCLSIFGSIQPGPLSSYAYQALHHGKGDDGLMQRFQVAVWPDMPMGEWKNVDRFPDTPAKQQARVIFQSLSGDIPGAILEDGADIPALRFSPGGQAVFDAWRGELEKEIRQDMPPVLEAHKAKYRSLMPSLALIFHLVDVASGALAGPVSERAAVMAAEWCSYLGSHAGRIFGAAVYPGMDAARELAKHIRRGELKDGTTLRAVSRPQWSRLNTPDDVRAGLETLQQHEWLCIEKTTTGGRPSEVVRLNPGLNFSRAA